VLLKLKCHNNPILPLQTLHAVGVLLQVPPLIQSGAQKPARRLVDQSGRRSMPTLVYGTAGRFFVRHSVFECNFHGNKMSTKLEGEVVVEVRGTYVLGEKCMQKY